MPFSLCSKWFIVIFLWSYLSLLPPLCNNLIGYFLYFYFGLAKRIEFSKAFSTVKIQKKPNVNITEIKNFLKIEFGVSTKGGIAKIEENLRTDSFLYDEFIIYKNKFNDISTNSNKAVISTEEESRSKSKIVNSFLELIDKIKEEDLIKFKNKFPLSKKRNQDVFKSNNQKKDVVERPKSFSELIVAIIWGARHKKIITALILIAGTIFLTWTNLPLKYQEKVIDTLIENIENNYEDFQTNYNLNDYQVQNRVVNIDLRAWKEVPTGNLRKERYSPVSVNEKLVVKKVASNNDVFIREHWINGYTLDIACNTINCKIVEGSRIEYNNFNFESSLKKYQVIFDVSDIFRDEIFDLDFQRIYWNCFQKQENESYGISITHPTEELLIEVSFPKGITKNDIVFRWQRYSANSIPMFIEPKEFSMSNNKLTWKIMEPRLNTIYFIGWRTNKLK